MATQPSDLAHLSGRDRELVRCGKIIDPKCMTAIRAAKTELLAQQPAPYTYVENHRWNLEAMNGSDSELQS